jgi:hypothetical protein
MKSFLDILNEARISSKDLNLDIAIIKKDDPNPSKNYIIHPIENLRKLIADREIDPYFYDFYILDRKPNSTSKDFFERKGFRPITLRGLITKYEITIPPPQRSFFNNLRKSIGF